MSFLLLAFIQAVAVVLGIVGVVAFGVMLVEKYGLEYFLIGIIVISIIILTVIFYGME